MNTDGDKSKGTILCADDDETVLEMIDALLGNRGYRTILAHDGEQALALYRQHKDELVAAVLDLRMPKMDGIALAGAIRKESKTFPLIALSAYLGGTEGKSVLKQCQEVGFSAYTTKPFATEPFLTALADWIQRYTKGLTPPS
jgi:CheY-like chemotaxis protein